jgi:hypothetical protein
MDPCVLPRTEYGGRLSVGGDAQGLQDEEAGSGRGAVAAQDPRLAFTYGEFPLGSLDELLDRAEACSISNQVTDESGGGNVQRRYRQRRLTFVDVGSGCGRLCLYVALTRPDWDVTGIECAPLLHQQAVQATQRAIKAGYMRHSALTDHDPIESAPSEESNSPTTVRFECAMANAATSTLHQADILFGYSTTWESSGFSTATSSMLLSQEWQELFTSCCRPGAIVITTDRSLDASSTGSWRMLDQASVGNPEVGGSMGYIQRRV